jgi:hypothetical protein
MTSRDTVKELSVERSSSPEREETPPEQIREVETMIPSENVIELQEESSALHDEYSHVVHDYEVEIVPPQTIPNLLRRKRPFPVFHQLSQVQGEESGLLSQHKQLN